MSYSATTLLGSSEARIGAHCRPEAPGPPGLKSRIPCCWLFGAVAGTQPVRPLPRPAARRAATGEIDMSPIMPEMIRCVGNRRRSGRGAVTLLERLAVLGDDHLGQLIERGVLPVLVEGDLAAL